MSCGEMDSLSSFSKRKYLKKSPKQKAVEKVIQPETEAYASYELTSEAYVLDEVPELDEIQKIEEPTELIILKEVPSTVMPSAYQNHQMESLLDKLVKDVKYNQYKSNQRDGEGKLLEALFASGAPWWVILLILFICMVVFILSGY